MMIVTMMMMIWWSKWEENLLNNIRVLSNLSLLICLSYDYELWSWWWWWWGWLWWWLWWCGEKNLFNNIKVFSDFSLLHHHFPSNSIAREHCLKHVNMVMLMIIVQPAQGPNFQKQQQIVHLIIVIRLEKCWLTSDIASLSCCSRWLKIIFKEYWETLQTGISMF